MKELNPAKRILNWAKYLNFGQIMLMYALVALCTFMISVVFGVRWTFITAFFLIFMSLQSLTLLIKGRKMVPSMEPRSIWGDYYMVSMLVAFWFDDEVDDVLFRFAVNIRESLGSILWPL